MRPFGLRRTDADTRMDHHCHPFPYRVTMVVVVVLDEVPSTPSATDWRR